MGTLDYNTQSSDEDDDGNFCDNTLEDRSLTAKSADSDTATTVPQDSFSQEGADSRDDDDDDDDDDDAAYSSDLGYSDDSASLSDAYFCPQMEDLGRPSRMAFSASATDGLPLLNDQPNYGAILQHQQQQYQNNSHPHHNHHHNPERATSPLWMAEPIQEDVEMNQMGQLHHQMTMSKQADSHLHGRRRERKKRRRIQRQNQQQHQQSNLSQQPRRSLNVSNEENGNQQQQQQQQSKWKDKWFAIVFLIQLALVCMCALRFGVSVVRLPDGTHASWTAYGKFHWQTESSSSSTSKTKHSHAGHNSNRFRYLAEVVQGNASTAAENYKMVVEDTTSAHSDARTDDFVDVNDQPSTANFSYKGDSRIAIDFHNVIILVGISGFYACLLTYLSFGFMLILARSLIQIMLVFSILLSLAWGMIGVYLDPYGIISVMGFTALVLTLGHTMYNWNRIPFAATNLYTALCAMRCTSDITVLGLTSLALALGWCIIWSMAFTGLVNSLDDRPDDNNCGSMTNPCPAQAGNNEYVPLMLLLLFSFHWTCMVIKNVVRVTVASAIGTWWFYPREISRVCSPAVVRPLSRAVSSSLGSICLGSLVVQPAHLASVFMRCCMGSGQDVSPNPCFVAGSKLTHEQKRSHVVEDKPHHDSDSPADTVGLSRKLDTGARKLTTLLRACNRWSFTYIGMYSYSFVEAGERALQLFETRDWMNVVPDNLIQNVLFMSSVVIGGSTGVFAVVVEESDGYEFSSFNQPMVTAFVVGSIVGYMLSDILLLGVVGSAVNTVLVCFAAAPLEFERNHPSLSREMRETWSQQVWQPAAAAAAAQSSSSSSSTSEKHLRHGHERVHVV